MIGAFIGGVYVEGLPLVSCMGRNNNGYCHLRLKLAPYPKSSSRSKNKARNHNPLKHLCLNPIRWYMLYLLAVFSCWFVPCRSCLASFAGYLCPQLAHCLDCLSSFDKGCITETEKLGHVLWQLCRMAKPQSKTNIKSYPLFFFSAK